MIRIATLVVGVSIIGCDLAGGNPEKIKKALEQTDLNVVIFK